MINWFAAKKVQAQLGAPLAVTAVTHTHTRTQSYARALSLCRSLALCLLLGPTGFQTGLSSLRCSPPLPLFRLLLLLLGEISRRYCSHICLSCRCRCSLPAVGCAAASSLLVCWCLRRFYRRRSAFHCLNLCALAPALSLFVSFSPSLCVFCGFRSEFVLI